MLDPHQIHVPSRFKPFTLPSGLVYHDLTVPRELIPVCIRVRVAIDTFIPALLHVCMRLVPPIPLPRYIELKCSVQIANGPCETQLSNWVRAIVSFARFHRIWTIIDDDVQDWSDPSNPWHTLFHNPRIKRMASPCGSLNLDSLL